MTTAAFDPTAYTKDLRRTWSRVAPHFDKVSTGYFAEATEPFFDFAGIEYGDRVLDVACGPGTSTLLAARRAGPEGETIGVDLSPEMIGIAKRRGGAAFKVMDAEELRFSAAEFDAVTCHLGVMLFARPKTALHEMARVLRPGGTLSCLVLGSASRMVFTNLLSTILPRYAPQLRAPGAPGLGDFAAPERLEAALAGAGLERESSRVLRGTFAVATPQRYWNIVTSSFGRLGPIIAALSPKDRASVRREAFERLEDFRKDDRLELPYEFVMAKGFKPSLRRRSSGARRRPLRAG